MSAFQTVTLHFYQDAQLVFQRQRDTGITFYIFSSLLIMIRKSMYYE